MNRLTAIAADIELLAEAIAGQGPAYPLRPALDALRAYVTDAACDARSIVGLISAHLQPIGVETLHIAVRETLAPLRRHLDRRGTIVILPEIPEDVCVEIEAGLLRAAIAAALGAVLAGARSSEVLRIAFALRGKHAILDFSLEADADDSPAPTADPELGALCAWLEVRGGALRIHSDRSTIAVSLALPSGSPEAPC